jgi:proteic killer suppression protein
LRLQLGQLDAASGPEDMNRPGWRCHPLKGRLEGIGLSGSMRAGD